METRVEQVGGGVEVWVSPQHTFGTDSFLLSHFAQPRRGETVCDLCSGCGIVPLLWFRGGDGPAMVHAVDIQPEAVALMEQSVTHSGLTGRMLPLLADLRSPAALREQGGLALGQYHRITCNPPYFVTGSGLPSQQDSDLIARHDGLCTTEDLCSAAESLLRWGGRLCLCQVPERLVDVITAMRTHRIEPKRLRFVHQQAGDAPWLVLVEGRRGGAPSLKIEPPLIMRQGQEPSPEMAEIYSLYGKV